MLGFLKKNQKQEKKKLLAEKNENKIEKLAKQKKPISLRQQRKKEKENAKLHSNKLKELDKSTDKLNTERKKKLKREAPPKTAQETIKYKRMFECGICEINEGLYSKTIKISDINYQIARREEQVDIFTKYCEVLNYCDPSMNLQISIVNRRIDHEDFKSNMFSQIKNDSLDIYRKELNEILGEKALQGQNSLLREKYVTFSTNATSYINAISVLSRLETDLISQFKGLGCDVSTLNGLQRLELIHEMNMPNEKFTFKYDDLVESSLTTKSAVAPSSFDFSTSKNQFQVDNEVGQMLFMKDLPAE